MGDERGEREGAGWKKQERSIDEEEEERGGREQ